MRYFFARGGYLPAGVLVALLLGVQASRADNPPASEPSELDVRIARLVTQLGDPQFAVREKAQAELGQIGLPAFDALKDAQGNDDVEIAFRARSLLKAIQVDWSVDSDPVEVKRSLRGYGELSSVDRRSRIDRLALMEDRAGLPALARLVRFETDEPLARYAALKLLVPAGDASAKDREQWVRVLKQTAGTSQRPTVAWLRLYARTLEEPAATLGAWQEVVNREHQLWRRMVDGGSDRQLQDALMRDLFRWQAQLLIQEKQREPALAVMRRTLEMVDVAQKEQVLDLVSWFAQQEAWELVEETSNQLAEAFAEQPVLLYRLAEAQLRLDKKEAAEKTAATALASRPDQFDEHLKAAFNLQNRGLFPWAEQEYNLIIDRGTEGSFFSVQGCFRLSEMQHDQGQEAAAAKTLHHVVKWMDEGAKKNDVLQLLENWGREPGAIRSRWRYFVACDLLEKKDVAGARKELERAVDSDDGDPSDADVLISLFRLPSQTAAQTKKTQDLIEAAVVKFREEIQQHRQQLEQVQQEQLQAYYTSELATANNQMAWLIGNTTGDFEEAVQASHRSLELKPETGAYYDTLARCYFSKGDFASAVKYQKQALRNDPHSGQMKRQLASFQKALDSQPPKTP